jgi:hypothetical protein
MEAWMPEPNFIDQLAEVSRRQGKPFIDPRRIEGFGEGSPPPPPLEDVKIPTAAEMFGGEPVDLPAETPAQSPLIAAAGGFKLVPEAIQQPARPDLLVMGNQAAYRDRGVELTEREQAVVASVVLKAIKRSLSEQFAALERSIPKRPYHRKAVAEQKHKKRRAVNGEGT